MQEPERFEPEFTSVQSLIDEINRFRLAQHLSRYQPNVDDSSLSPKVKSSLASLDRLTKIIMDQLVALPDLKSNEAARACDIAWSLLQSIENVTFQPVSRAAEAVNFFHVVDRLRAAPLLKDCATELVSRGKAPYRCDINRYQNVEPISEFPTGPFKIMKGSASLNTLLVHVHDYLTWRVGLHVYNEPINPATGYVDSPALMAHLPSNLTQSMTPEDIQREADREAAFKDFTRAGWYFQVVPWKKSQDYQRTRNFTEVYLVGNKILSKEEMQGRGLDLKKNEKLYKILPDLTYVDECQRSYVEYCKSVGVSYDEIVNPVTTHSYQEHTVAGYRDYIAQFVSQLDFTTEQMRAGAGAMLINYLCNYGGQAALTMVVIPLLQINGAGLLASQQPRGIWRLNAASKAIEIEYLDSAYTIKQDKEYIIAPGENPHNRLIDLEDYKQTLGVEEQLFFDAKQLQPIVDIRAVMEVKVELNDETSSYELVQRIKHLTLISNSPDFPANGHFDYRSIKDDAYQNSWLQAQQASASDREDDDRDAGMKRV